jgi:hypothetical protein
LNETGDGEDVGLLDEKSDAGEAVVGVGLLAV